MTVHELWEQLGQLKDTGHADRELELLFDPNKAPLPVTGLWIPDDPAEPVAIECIVWRGKA